MLLAPKAGGGAGKLPWMAHEMLSDFHFQVHPEQKQTSRPDFHLLLCYEFVKIVLFIYDANIRDLFNTICGLKYSFILSALAYFIDCYAASLLGVQVLMGTLEQKWCLVISYFCLTFASFSVKDIRNRLGSSCHKKNVSLRISATYHRKFATNRYVEHLLYCTKVLPCDF